MSASEPAAESGSFRDPDGPGRIPCPFWEGLEGWNQSLQIDRGRWWKTCRNQGSDPRRRRLERCSRRLTQQRILTQTMPPYKPHKNYWHVCLTPYKETEVLAAAKMAWDLQLPQAPPRRLKPRSQYLGPSVWTSPFPAPMPLFPDMSLLQALPRALFIYLFVCGSFFIFNFSSHRVLLW